MCWTSWDVRAVSNVSSRRHGTSHLNRPCVGNHADLSAGSNTWCGRQASFSAKFAANPLFFSSTEPGASKDPFFRGTPCAAFFCCWRQRKMIESSQNQQSCRHVEINVRCHFVLTTWQGSICTSVCLYLLICIDLHTTLNPV